MDPNIYAVCTQKNGCEKGKQILWPAEEAGGGSPSVLEITVVKKETDPLPCRRRGKGVDSVSSQNNGSEKRNELLGGGLGRF